MAKNSSVKSVAFDKNSSFIPAPKSMEMGDGFFDFSQYTESSPIFLASPAEFSTKMDVVAKQLCDSGLPCKLTAAITSVAGRIAAFSSSSITVYKDKAIENREGYTLIINSDGIRVNSSTDTGAYYALQTLRQLIMENAESKKAKCMVINDEPVSEWRGLLIDTSRTFYPVEFLEKMIDAASFHKMNRFHWHLTDDQGWRIFVPEYPKLTEIGSVRDDRRYSWEHQKKAEYYTDEEIKHLVKFAENRGVIVVPEIETPGHALAVLAAYPELGCTGGPYRVEDRFGIFDDVLCAGNDKVFEVFEAVFNTVCRLFPGPYIHIGGDECPRTRWYVCPKCQKRIKDEKLSSENELQSYLTVKFADMIEQRGRIPVGWDEVLEGTEKLGLPKKMIVQSWRGQEGGKNAVSLGHKAIMSPQTNGCYLDWKPLDNGMEPGMHHTATVHDSWMFNPMPDGLDEKQSSMILGGQCNLWTEVVYAPKIAEYMIFPRLCAIAEKLWCGTKETQKANTEESFLEFSNRLEIHKKCLDKLDILFYNGKLE